MQNAIAKLENLWRNQDKKGAKERRQIACKNDSGAGLVNIL